MFGFDPSFFSSLLQVIFIDLVLAGDNAVVIGLAAAGLAPDLRRKAIMIGILAATVLRIGFALITTQLLSLGGGLLVAGGILLLWVCWKLWRDLREAPGDPDAALPHEEEAAEGAKRKTFGQAVWQIVVADVSMSLDNVLAVAGAAREHPAVLVGGLALSIALMGLAASFIARQIGRAHV